MSASVNVAKAGVNYRVGGAAAPAVIGRTQGLLPPPALDWTGCYVGVHGGGGILNDTFVGEVVNQPVSGGGAIAGTQVGCNYQSGMMVVGLEGEAAWSGMAIRSGLAIGGAFPSTSYAADRNRWNADIAARAGVAFDRALVYGKAGAASGRFDLFGETNGAAQFFDGSTTLTGLLLGAGMEYAFAPNWSAKLEYDHVGYLSRSVGFTTSFGPFVNSERAATDLVKAGVNYKFFGPSDVVVARD
jgi:outer membrane immunogenic protein